jgi:hypothetical protein
VGEDEVVRERDVRRRRELWRHGSFVSIRPATGYRTTETGHRADWPTVGTARLPCPRGPSRMRLGLAKETRA